MSDHIIYVIGGNDDESGVLTVFPPTEVGCKLSFLFRGERLEATAADYFDAFLAIRHELEPMGLIPFCYAASLDVYPSRMARQMSNGLVAYRLEIGKQATERVNIFDDGRDVIPATAANQTAYFSEWVSSLRAH